MRPLKYIPRYTVADYNLWEGNWELIDGLPYAMSPSPMKKHQILASLLLRQIGSSIEKEKDSSNDCVEVHELDWVIDDNTVLRPDIAIICDKSGNFITSPPALIVEIISSSTALKDRQIKFEIYQEQGVKYYLIVDPDTKTYNVYVLAGKQYKEQKSIGAFLIHDKCSIKIDVEKALAELK